MYRDGKLSSKRKLELPPRGRMPSPKLQFTSKSVQTRKKFVVKTLKEFNKRYKCISWQN